MIAVTRSMYATSVISKSGIARRQRGTLYVVECVTQIGAAPLRAADRMPDE